MPLLAHHGVTPRLHPTAFLAGGARLIGEIELGERASVWFNAVLRGDITKEKRRYLMQSAQHYVEYARSFVD